MGDEIRLISQVTGDVYSNSVCNKIAVIKVENNVMMTAKEIAVLYGVSRVYITQKLKKLYKEKVLEKKRVSNIFSHQATDGKLYETRYYNQEAIIAIGLHIKPQEAAAFQEWLDVSNSNQIN